jgi:hypothetical protein
MRLRGGGPGPGLHASDRRDGQGGGQFRWWYQWSTPTSVCGMTSGHRLAGVSSQKLVPCGWGIRRAEGTEHGVDGVKGVAEHPGLLALSLGRKQEVVNIDISICQGKCAWR